MKHSTSSYQWSKSGVEINDDDKTRRGDLNALLRSWIAVVDHARGVLGEERAAYSYKEQTNVGILAGAAIKIDWVALEECAINKSMVPGVKNDGRVDLSLWANNERRYLMEAKLTARSVDTLKDRIDVVVDVAKRDATKLRSEVAATRYAVVFVIPRFSKLADPSMVENGINEAIEMCRDKEPKADFLAYTFPGKAKRKASDRMDAELPSVFRLPKGELHATCFSCCCSLILVARN